MLALILSLAAPAASACTSCPDHAHAHRPTGTDVWSTAHASSCCPFHAMAVGEPVETGLPMDKWPVNKKWPADKSESSLANLLQLTFGGQNAEAYWNVRGNKIVWQTRQPEYPDEQIYIMNADGSNKQRVSTGLGRTTCSYFLPGDQWIYFSSTHDKNRGAQIPLDMSKGYVWKINPQFSLWRARPDGSQVQKVLDTGHYVAETTISPDGKYMVWTGMHEGDIEIYRTDLATNKTTRLTQEEGYDGGPFVSWDGKKIVYRRAPEFANAAERDEYRQLRKENLVRPSRMDLWIMDADGRNKRKVTDLGAASFAPFMHPDGKRIIFSSNHHDPRRREFDLFIVNVDGSGLKQITFSPDFDGFPMFTRDGKKLIWASNRHGAVPRETNVFVADWRD